ncbi:MAG: DNA repair protein RadA [Flavobacteriaceae bacterium]|jgi:DNA repair protein RadA/Sms|nr:DNA repair protein RadA [Flavobacteriaceae bacterium]MDG1968321.1 DNA repair protein RadA [Flavobacteriaceae bacterium]HCZ09753.1 DNA repair protein RadA [Flavobacteriaceae bacterium]|tara:strand:+ start:779 stop:2137 length:1359 start_codon:yes stop_codon:yes gene_type:complete
MSKVKTAFYCQNCGTQHAKWQGQCNSCKKWNTLTEEVIEKGDNKSWKSENKSRVVSKPIKVQEIEISSESRIDTHDAELNRVLGGGIIPGALMLLGGEPGIGKSTLLLQIAMTIGHKVLYVSGEESQQQIKIRADRMNTSSENCYILSETKTQHIFSQIEALEPQLVIIDSVQTLHTDYIDSGPGSISQIKECTAEFIRFAKETHVPVFLVGHITKDGQIAGPKILEHMVDVVLHFEGDRNHIYRILRTQKNRFGATSEIGIYEMQSQGLRAVSNPSELLISEKDEKLSGHAIAATIEGIRPLMIEIQALVSTAVYGTPQRTTTGYNTKRLNMLLAVLEKRAGFALGTKDVFINITGGITIADPAIDLAVIVAILSSYHDTDVPDNFCFAAEVGLSGEIRPVPKTEQRVQEAAKLGFNTIVISKFAKIGKPNGSINVLAVSKIEALVSTLFG